MVTDVRVSQQHLCGFIDIIDIRLYKRPITDSL